MNKNLLITVVAVLLLGVISFFSMNYFSSKKEEIVLPKSERELPKVKTEPVVYGDHEVHVEQTGRLMSTGRVVLIAEVSGKILAGDVPLLTGQSFKKGDIVLRIFDEEAKLSLQAAKSRYLSSIAGVLPDIKYDYAEDYQLWLDFFNGIRINQPLPEIPKVDSENERIYLASRNILNDYFTIQSSEVRLQKYTIRAPFNGAFTQVNLEVGSIANPGSRIAEMIKTDVLELQVPISIQEIDYVKKGDPVLVEVNGEKVKGSVNRVSDFVDASSQSILVYVELHNTPKLRLYEGMYLKAYFAETKLQQVEKIPRQALFNFNQVYIVVDGRLSKQTVKIVKMDEYVAYITGLNEGSQLVIESLVNASNNLKVKMVK